MHAMPIFNFLHENRKKTNFLVAETKRKKAQTHLLSLLLLLRRRIYTRRCKYINIQGMHTLIYQNIARAAVLKYSSFYT